MTSEQPDPELAGDPVHEGPDDTSGDPTATHDQDAEPPTPTGEEPDVDDAGAEHPDP